MSLIFVSLFSTIYVAWISRDLPNPDKLTDRQVAQSTKIYDRTGEHLLYEIFADEKRTLVELNEIPEYLIQGVIATEDTKFYEHKGIRPLSIIRGFVYGIFTKKRVGGSSTLTQQLVKNAILTNERTISRKIKEAILSIRLEQKYTKDQILKIYFNEIPYGSTNYGVESASQSYFGKHVSEVTLSEAATLAGLPKAPSTYLNNSEALKNRRNFVLGRMKDEGYISKEEAEQAQTEELNIKEQFTNIKAPHFVLYVRKLLVKEYGEALVDTGGLKVITTLDWEKQNIAEQAVEKTDELLKKAGADNIALVAIDPKTNQILSLVGSKDFFDESIKGKFDVVTMARRQPGSSIKPIIYAAAFNKGYTPETILFDVITNFAVSGTSYEPRNYDLTEHGPVTMRQALQGSLNIVAVKTLYLVGIEQAISFAQKLGYNTFNKDTVGLSLVLGGGEVNMLEHANAFAVFANNGVRYDDPISILRVEDRDGKNLQEWKKKHGDQVISKEAASSISNVLSDDAARAYIFGAGSLLTLPGRPVATKTGTTNSYVDAWTIGYTPSLATAVWAGNTNNSPMSRGFGGSGVAAPVWNEFMREALKNSPVEYFPSPPSNNSEKPVLKGTTGGSITLLIDKVTGKLATSSTPEKYITERRYLLPHSILHYVIKDDPQGPAPEKPEDDPQYTIWEQAIQDWIKRKKEENPEWEVSLEDPPTEFDDQHSLDLIPTLTVVYPSASSSIYSRQIDTDIRVSAPRGVTKVTYKIDRVYVGVVREHPFNLHYFAADLNPGQHILSILVEDDVGNQINEDIIFILEAEEHKPGVFWNNPPQSLNKSTFPHSLTLRHVKLDQIANIIIKAQIQQEESNLLEWNLETIKNPADSLFDNQILFSWKEAPELSGTWDLVAYIELKDGTTKESDRIKISIL
ncbi:MAG: PBP1A family penicillin-binding protein [Candidatus Magasanikbacteria bacterium]|nr:PBP1A family penicillin-binding protein [Candidatus Magasanikbacteria bacterium]